MRNDLLLIHLHLLTAEGSEKCKKRKIKCSGETPCRQCVKHKAAVCVYDRSIPGNSTTSAIIQRPEGTISSASNLEPPAHSNALWPLSREQAKDLLETLSEDIDTLYPFIDLQEMKALVDICFDNYGQLWNSESNIQTARWDGLDDGRNLDLLKSLLICTLSTERNLDGDPSVGFLSAVEKNHCERVQMVDVDIKDVAIATILVRFFSFRFYHLFWGGRPVRCSNWLCNTTALRHVFRSFHPQEAANESEERVPLST